MTEVDMMGIRENLRPTICSLKLKRQVAKQVPSQNERRWKNYVHESRPVLFMLLCHLEGVGSSHRAPRCGHSWGGT